MEEYTNVVTLTDEEGNEIEFEILDIVPFEDAEYAVLLPVDDDSEDPEAVILEVLHAGSDDEEDMLQGVEDEALLEKIFDLFVERNPDLFKEEN